MQNTERQMRGQAYRSKLHEPTAHLIGDTPDFLARINEPDVNISIWQRPSIDQIERTCVSYASGSTRCPLPLQLEQI